MNAGDIVEVVIERPAHGGVGIGAIPEDSRICLVRGGLVGDVVQARITRAKKSFYQAEIVRVVQPSPMRVEQRCPAAIRGAGCCDFGTVALSEELPLKVAIVKDQLRRIAGLEQVPEPALIPLEPHTGWRTRWRLGVDAEGRAGLREHRGNRVVWDAQCIQAPHRLLDGIVGTDARRFTPGSEIVVALGSDGARTIAEVRRAGRGNRVEHTLRPIEGSEVVFENVHGVQYRLSATTFWQAHAAAPETYVDLAATWLREALTGHTGTGVGWDLYGGVGLFVPALVDALRTTAATKLAVHSVETSPHAGRFGARALREYPVCFHRRDVERQVALLPQPDAVVLDPPRQGAGAPVIGGIAAAGPRAVLHIGCDPATFARDCASWYEHGYACTRLAVVNAFPGTHHSETFGLFEPLRGGIEGHNAA